MKIVKCTIRCFFLLLVTALFWAMPATTWGYTVTKNNVKYELNDSKMTASATGYSGPPTAVTIPVVINDGGKDYTVTSIGENAFYKCKSLTSIKIPASVNPIRWDTFDIDGTRANGFNDPKISFDFIEGKLVLAFTGTLEGSEDGKQWTAINATSPYTVEMTGGKKFFRAVGVQGGNEPGGAGSAGVGENFIIPLSETVNLEMIWVEPGTFKMGSPEGELGRFSDETQHQVTLTKGYWLGKYEVTQGQYEAVMGNNPSKFMGENLPVERVTWYNAMDFCARLTEIERAAGRLPEGYEYTLPTEAQWEYACRAGTTEALNSGRNLTDEYECFNLDEVGWYYYNSDQQTHPVGGKQPNTWGFYDMHGNVYEWCLDWFGDYPTGSVTDPRGPANGSDRVIRGGWGPDADDCRSALRYGDIPSDASYDYDGLCLDWYGYYPTGSVTDPTGPATGSYRVLRGGWGPDADDCRSALRYGDIPSDASYDYDGLCLDWYGDYPTGSVTDPTGPATGWDRVVRGGSWGSYAYCCRSALRLDYDPSNSYDYIGFRVALSPVQ